jgi:hypothetical protein
MKKSLLAVCLALSVVLISSCAGGMVKNFAPAAGETPYAWKSVVTGGGGFVPGIIFHPSQKDAAYLRTDMGGAYRWNAGTKAWDCVTDAFGKDESEYNGILSLALDPNDANRVYMMTGKYTNAWAGKGAFQISNDKGNTWKTIQLELKVGGNENGRGAGERVAVDPNLSSIIYMGSTKDGLWKSSDYGETWSRVMQFTPVNVDFVAFDGSSGKTGAETKRIFAAADDKAGSLYVSNDAGGSWTLVPGQPQGLVALRNAIADGWLYMTYSDSTGPNGASKGSVWKYNMETGAWEDLKVPEGQGGFSGISIDPKDAKHIIVSTLNRWAPMDEIYLTHDGGKKWLPLLANAVWDSSYAPYSKPSDKFKPHWIADVKMDPYNPDRALFVTGYGIWESKNINSKKVTWSFNDGGIEEPVPLQIISPPKGARLFTALGDIDGFRYESDPSKSPADRYQPAKGTTLSIAAAWQNPQLMVKTFNRPPFGAFSKDNGKTWEDFSNYPGDTKRGGSRSIAISSDGKAIVWAPEKGKSWKAENNKLYYSINNGVQWDVCAGLPDGEYHPVADTINPEKFYVFSGAEGAMYVSADSGVTFVKTMTGLPVQKDDGWQFANCAAAPDREGDIWLSSNQGGFYRSLDSGKTASLVSSVDEAYRFGFGKSASGAGYPAIYLWGTIHGVTGVFRSDDTAATWTRINDNSHQYGWIHSVTGDPMQYGRCYISAEGRGTFYGDPR